jgi:hypothetical protein
MSDSNEEMAETAEKLGSALDEAEDESDEAQKRDRGSDGDSSAFVGDIQRGLRDGLRETLGTGDTASTGSGLGEQFGRLLGEMVVRKLTDQLRELQTASEADTNDLTDPAELVENEIDGESLSEMLGDTALSGVKDDIEDGQEVIEETGELLETVDVSELPDAVDVSELPEAIDFEEVPAAIANAEPERAVELKQLASLVEFDELWDAVDVREFMQEKDDLEDAVGDLTGDEDGSDESSLTDSLGSSDSSLTDSLGSSSDSGGGESLVAQGEAMQAAIQSKLRDSVEEFRENVLDAREQVKEARDTAQETVEEKTGGGTGQPSSRNPTAYSTMVSGWQTGGWSSANFSTVPQTTQHSSAPGHFRIYGQRFEEEEDDE